VTERLRVVCDTNVFLSAELSKNPSGPTRELFQRWRSNEFDLLVSDALVDEVVEQLRDHGIQEEAIVELTTLLEELAQWVEVPAEAVARVVPADPDDDVILACAIVGKADYLVTYDAHFNALGGVYAGLRIMGALPFLRIVRDQ